MLDSMGRGGRTMADLLAVLGRHPYFSSLPPSIPASVRTRVLTRSYKTGTLIYAEGNLSQGLYLVACGSVRIFKGSEEGKEQDLHHITAGILQRCRRVRWRTDHSPTRSPWSADVERETGSPASLRLTRG